VTENQDGTDAYERRYGSFEGHPGFIGETRSVDVLLDGLERRRLISLGRYRSYADLGCGLGFKTYAFARRFEHSVGFDAAKTAVELANRLNDLPTLAFRVADVLTYEPDEAFDFVTAIGLSAFNSADVGQTARRVVTLADRYLADGGGFLVVMSTDCSGSERDGWYHLSARELRGLVGEVDASRRYRARLYAPQRDVRTYVTFGPEFALRELGKWVLRHPRTHCMLVNRA
jgi:SAM-dependent methyltransferase